MGKQCQSLFWGAPKSLQMVTAAMKLKDTYSLEGKLWPTSVQFTSVDQSCPTLWPHESQHTRPPCPSPTPRVYPNPCPLNRWCHPAISFSVVPFSSCPQSFPALGSFPMSQLFKWGGQSIGVSASTSVLPLGLISFRMNWLDLLAIQGIFKNFLQHHSSKTSILQCSAFFSNLGSILKSRDISCQQRSILSKLWFFQ